MAFRSIHPSASMTCNRFTRLVLATRTSAVPAVATSFYPDKSTGPSLFAIPMTP